LGVTVSVPADAGCNDFDTATVIASSQHTAAASDSAILTTSANADYCLTLEPPIATLQGDPGSDVVYALTATNTGISTDTFDVSIGGNNWPTIVPLTLGPLGSGMSATLGITVSVPLTAVCGDVDIVTVTATSQQDAEGSDSSRLFTIPHTTCYIYFALVVKNR
jgi:uncharacterized membrane protein